MTTIILSNMARFQIINRSSGGNSGKRLNSVRGFEIGILVAITKDMSALEEEAGGKLDDTGLCSGATSASAQDPGRTWIPRRMPFRLM